MSHIAVLSGQYHLSISKIHRLLRESYSSYFSTEPISEAQGKVSTMLRPLHQVLGYHVKQSAVIHIDEILHQRNGEAATCWVWLLNGSNTVYQKIRAYCNAETAKSLLGETKVGALSSLLSVLSMTGWSLPCISSAGPMSPAICNRWLITVVTDSTGTAGWQG
ncbi:IS66 family transposase [Photorhabdus sp. CRCIA-P01]|uniref:IS66 family transposase n=1 Tax=Photorhabdus sp. CRCIA-P01 TaxID=2019570 RepID=UPI00130081FD|nr:transposase [Photorhabdus sp. CRCIA-P01]